MKKDTIIDYLKGLNITGKDDYDKKYLCNSLEQELIKKEIEARRPKIKDKKMTAEQDKLKLIKYYYKLEESIIYRIGEKK